MLERLAAMDADSSSALMLDPLPPGDPSSWALNELGQPEWLLVRPRAHAGGAWGVIVPPAPEVNPPRADRLALGLDRRDQGLEPWGFGRSIREVGHILAL